MTAYTIHTVTPKRTEFSPPAAKLAATRRKELLKAREAYWASMNGPVIVTQVTDEK